MLLDILSGTALPGEYAFIVLCMAAAWMAGRSVANDWKPAWNLVVVSLLLGAGARFLHFALYEAHFLSFSHFATDVVLLGAIVVAGWRHTRTSQMTRQYNWLYERTSPFSWRSKG